MAENLLGSQAENPQQYQPDILYPIPRRANRYLLDIDKKILLYGVDHWRAYELSWLNNKGKPQVAVAEFFFNAESENIVESKSLKLYLNSLNQERYESVETVRQLLAKDLSSISLSEVKVDIHFLGELQGWWPQLRAGRSIDNLDIECESQQTDPELLSTEPIQVDDGQLYSDLFKSNCPVTGQPDWGSFELRYTGKKINEPGLLRYLLTYRWQQAYHEACAERIFRDILLACQPSALRIGMNFLRRGGLDINVYRSTAPVGHDSVNKRLIRQ